MRARTVSIIASMRIIVSARGLVPIAIGIGPITTTTPPSPDTVLLLESITYRVPKNTIKMPTTISASPISHILTIRLPGSGSMPSNASICIPI